MTLKTRVSWSGQDGWDEFAGVNVPKRFEMTVTPTDDDPQPAYVITVQIVDGAPQVEEVRVTATDHGRGVERSDLALPLEDHVEFAARWVAALHAPSLSGQASIDLDELNPEFLTHHRRARRTDLRGGPTDEDLRKVAEIYCAADRAPTKSVREHFNLGDRTATLWVKRARAKGYLE